jgi:hypothetical protein
VLAEGAEHEGLKFDFEAATRLYKSQQLFGK